MLVLGVTDATPHINQFAPIPLGKSTNISPCRAHTSTPSTSAPTSELTVPTYQACHLPRRLKLTTMPALNHLVVSWHPQRNGQTANVTFKNSSGFSPPSLLYSHTRQTQTGILRHINLPSVFIEAGHFYTPGNSHTCFNGCSSEPSSRFLSSSRSSREIPISSLYLSPEPCAHWG